MGRRSEMRTLVGKLEASATARERVKVILLTLGGGWSVKDACERLGISRTRFQDLRRRFLQAGIAALEGGARGRPRGASRRGEASPLQCEVSKLRHRVRYVRTQVDIFDSGLSEAPRVREALHRAHVAGGSV